MEAYNLCKTCPIVTKKCPVTGANTKTGNWNDGVPCRDDLDNSVLQKTDVVHAIDNLKEALVLIDRKPNDPYLKIIKQYLMNPNRILKKLK